jgi:flagellar protein FliO/FliZ
MRCLAMLLLGTVLTAGDSPVFTDQEWTNSQPQAAQPVVETPGWGSVASLGVGLVVVVALAVGMGWAAKRMNARRLLGGRGRVMELVETIQIAPRRQLALVRLGGQWLVVGVGEKELNHIATMPAPIEPPAVATPPAQPVAAQPSAFAGELARLVGGAPDAKP